MDVRSNEFTERLRNVTFRHDDDDLHNTFTFTFHVWVSTDEVHSAQDETDVAAHEHGADE